MLESRAGSGHDAARGSCSATLDAPEQGVPQSLVHPHRLPPGTDRTARGKLPRSRAAPSYAVRLRHLSQGPASLGIHPAGAEANVNGRPRTQGAHNTRIYGGQMASVKQFQVAFDCAEPERVARFWCEVLGYAVPPPPEGFSLSTALEL